MNDFEYKVGQRLRLISTPGYEPEVEVVKCWVPTAEQHDAGPHNRYTCITISPLRRDRDGNKLAQEYVDVCEGELEPV